MKICIQFFSRLKEIAVAEPIEKSVPVGSTVGDLLEELDAEFPRLAEWEGKLLIAVGMEFATRQQVLKEGDLVSLMPPVQGG
ncbi:MAG TPA: MoaD/ThiS family protein [Chthoniobacterales bacterium]